MKEKLIIKNFGPIKSVDLDLGKITVFIGEQATGKSTVAKVLSICRYFSYIVNYAIEVDKQSEFHNNEQFLKGLRDWGVVDYLKDNSCICYENELYNFEFKNELIIDYESVAGINDYKKEFYQTNTKITSKNDEFKKLLKQFQDLKNDEFSKRKEIAEPFDFDLFGWTPNENFYRLNVKKVMDNPSFIPTERVTQYIPPLGKNSSVSEAIQNQINKLNKIVIGFYGEIRIDTLSLTYKKESGLGFVKKDKDDSFHSLNNGASGYQSTIPIVLAVKYYNEIEKRKKTFIVEELEQNLFPKTQKKLMEFMVESVNKFENQFLLPTHSPYVLTSLGNLIYAHKLGTSEKGMFQKEVAKIIPKEFWIDVKDVSVYYLNNGEAKDLVDVEECLINLDDLDNVSEIINTKFDALLGIDIALEKEIK